MSVGPLLAVFDLMAARFRAVKSIMTVGKRKKGREGERERDRQTDRQTDRDR